MTDMRDELLDQVVDELRTLPPVDEAAVRRIVSEATGAGRVAGGGQRSLLSSLFASRVPLAAAAGFALTAGLAGYAIRGGPAPGSGIVATAVPAESVTSLASLLPAAIRLEGTRPLPGSVPTQFILDAPRASRVALVGDFNGWDAGATPLVRDSSSGIWTVTLPLAPGRHVYAFMVDGTALTLDPRAPAAQDPEFGTPSSVVLVGTP